MWAVVQNQVHNTDYECDKRDNEIDNVVPLFEEILPAEQNDSS